MAEFVQKLEDLAALDNAIHWFCPRSLPDDGECYFDEDIDQDAVESGADVDARHLKIKQAHSRRDDALEACKIFAFDGEDAITYQSKLKDCLKTQLTRCDICIREYHRARTLLLTSLEADYSAEDVQAFMQKFDSLNIDRITSGLSSMADTLLDLPPAERNILSAGDTGMYALFEALNCVPFLKSEQMLANSFDRPFKLVQTNKKVKLANYVPGMVSFLYSSNPDRRAWASRNFSQVKRSMLGVQFDQGVRPFLDMAMARVNVLALELDFLPTFWSGTRLILSKLTKELVTSHLRAMDVNLFALSLDHFQIDAPHFSDLIASYKIILDLSPNDFWDAVGNASPQSVIEIICQAPALQHMLKITEEKEDLKLHEKMAWTECMVRTIKPSNIVPPLRALLDQLLHKFQDDKYSRYARSVAWEEGLVCLLQAIKNVMTAVEGGPVYTHLIEAVTKDHMQVVLQELDGIEEKGEMQIDRTEQLGLDIMENILALDMKSLVRDRRIIASSREHDHETGLAGLNAWKQCVRHIKPGHPALVASMLSGLTRLLSLEKLPSTETRPATKQATAWNGALTKVTTFVEEDFLSKLESFNPEQLTELYQDPNGARGLMALLFNGSTNIHQPVLGLLKTLTSEDSRRESLMHVVNVFLGNTMSAASASLRLIAEGHAFSPCTVALKICTDIYSCLCDSSDGILRSRGLQSETEYKALHFYWENTWIIIGTIFENTEAWSSQGHDKLMMQDFCRETMDFADFAFDQYSVIASAMRDIVKGRDDTDIGKELLKVSSRAFRKIVKWLRLRDEYLVIKAVGLTEKMLSRFQTVDLHISDDSAQFLEDVVTSSEKNAKIKTKLTSYQKAELQRALERHLGESLSETLIADATAPKKQGSLQGWATTGAARGQNSIDLNAWTDAAKQKKAQATPIEGGFKGLKAFLSKADEKKASIPHRASSNLPAKKAPVKFQEDQKNFLLKRQQQKAEMEKQKQALLARSKVGVGSGVVGVGDIGKEHSVKGQNVMVDSDDEDEEDEDDDSDLDEDLFGPKNKDRKIRRPNVDPNGAIGLRPEQKKGPTRIHRTARTLQNTRARLAPRLDGLHRTILSWEYFHDGDYPPNSHPDRFSEVANSFTDPTSYQGTFEALLILEAWQGMVKSREENTSKPYEIKVQNRSNVDSFIEISSIVGHAENRELQLQEGDIILLSKAAKPMDDAGSKSPHALARIYRLKRQKAHLEVIYHIMPDSSLTPHLSPQSIIHGQKVQSIVPLEREYGALQALQYYDLCTQIIRAKPSPRINFTEKQVSTFQDVWNVNKAQSEAINAAMENEGFSLIQGPPGSGKTKTIVAIVGGLLSQTLNSVNTGGTRIQMPRAAGVNQNAPSETASKKLLVCAPSNAAVDELVMRLKDGVKTKNGRQHKINVVRIGRSDAINAQVLDVTMDELVSKRLGTGDGDSKAREQNANLFKEHEQVSAHLRELYSERDKGEVKGEEFTKLESSIFAARKRKNELTARIDNVKDQERNAGREAELNRKRAQQAILDEAHVICATLSGSGHDMFQSLNIEFETVIIDEAAQCVEMSSLIPLKYGCIKCIMVGDPKQLPPTVFSKEAAKFQYEQSLFVRMQNNFPNEVHLLDTQYRMHPDISVFPSQSFYDGLLKDGASMANLRKRPWHASSLLAPYRFYDVQGQHQAAPKGHSLINLAEIEVAMALYNRLITDFKGYDFNGQIGIITPYKSQLKALKDRFSRQYGPTIVDTVEFNTTDAFQGRESEVIIFSCVRASPAGGIGFLQDIRRMNVGLTRAKSSLWVLGNSESLIRGRYWKKLVDDAQARDAIVSGNIFSMLKKPSSSFPATSSVSRSMPDIKNEPQPNGRGNSHGRPDEKSRVASTNEQTNEDPTIKKENIKQDPDRMEGIRYKMEDRIAMNKKRAASEAKSEDVEMGDVDPSIPPFTDENGRKSGSGTPVPDENGSHKASSIPPPMRKKRPAAASPFLPKKPRPS